MTSKGMCLLSLGLLRLIVDLKPESAMQCVRSTFQSSEALYTLNRLGSRCFAWHV